MIGATLVVACFVGSGCRESIEVACTRIASPGTSLAGFANSLEPGDVGCLHAGTYGERGGSTTITAPGTRADRITITGVPGEARPRILGSTYLKSHHVTLSGLFFDGPAGPGSSSPGTRTNPRGEGILVWLEGRGLELADSDVSNGRAQGVFLTGAEGARVTGNHIHGNGNFAEPAVANLDHGVYFESGYGVVAHNVIDHNLAYGVQLYPSAHDVLVESNVITGHGRGGIIVGGVEGKPPPAGNRITGNVLAHNRRRAVESYGPVGAGNVVERNLSWANGPDGETASLILTQNFSVDPGFASTAYARLLVPGLVGYGSTSTLGEQAGAPP